MPDKPNPEELRKKTRILELLVFLHLRGDIDLRYADESGFNLTPNIPYGWTRQGEQKGIPTRKGGKLNIFGLMNPSGQLTSYQTSQNVDSQMVIDWLDDFAASIKKLTVVVLDNATPHKSKKFMSNIEKWEAQGLFIFYLPTYSPHLNPIEILWRKMKYEWLKPQDYLNKEIFHDALNNILKNYNNGDFKINFDFNKRCQTIFV